MTGHEILAGRGGPFIFVHTDDGRHIVMPRENLNYIEIVVGDYGE